ncbi:MAG: patatin-like phospholipase family protein [Pseudomonadota bacterium]
MTVTDCLTVRAGPGALRHLRERGFQPQDVRMMVGASGGAKWLVLTGLDRMLLSEVVPHFTPPVHLLGSSIGSWRFACYASPQPLAAIERFADRYINENYGEKPTAADISRIGEHMVRYILGDGALAHIVNNPAYRLHIMAVRARHLLASESKLALATGLGAAMLANHVSRRALGGFFERTLVHDARALPPAASADDLPMQQVALSADNLIPAIMASSAIPFVMQGVSPLPGALPGTYRDGGIIDYHFDVPLSCDDGLTLYPHFYSHLTPGWFDKKRPRRTPRPEHLDRVLLISPSAQFVASLPGARIPDRHDFVNLDNAERIQRWERVVAESDRLGDALLHAITHQQLAQIAQPLV